MAKRKILIVDDERPTREAMARVLSDKYECLQAADAEQAMKIVEATPDLALMISDNHLANLVFIFIHQRCFISFV